MSPGNSYFTEEVISKTFQEIISSYGEVGILIPDIPAIATYQALGYPENRARKDKAIPKGNALKNKCIRAMNNLGFSDKVHIFDWGQEVANNPLYRESYKNIRELYQNNISLQKSANSTTKSFLVNTKKPLGDIDVAVNLGVDYLLCELAFLEFLSKFLKKRIIYVYHKNWRVYEDYISGKFDKVNREHYLGFLKIAAK